MTTIMEFCTPPVPGETHAYYGDAHHALIKLPAFLPTPAAPVITKQHSTPVPVTSKPKQLSPDRTLHDLAAAGNVIVLKQVLLLLPDPLKAVNDAQSTTGYTPLHFAAARGHLDVVQCLLDDYSVSVDARDKEGETPLHKAAYNGHFSTVKYLLSKNANVHQKDKDGWTALHNACARGNLHIVRLLINQGARVDVQSKVGHTPLMNAASKGYISIVEYLLEEAHANPLIKNNNGEAAYDASAASGEAYICELLQKSGKRWWRDEHGPAGSYDVIQYHVSVVITLHENQRSTSLLGLSRPHFNASYLTKQDNSPWSLHPSGKASSKENVSLPQATDEHSANWCWMTEWEIDRRDPRVEPTYGWQYARSFDVPEDLWTPVAPTSGNGWVRRRRWVRVMNRQANFDGKLAIPQTDYLARAEDLILTNAFTSSDRSDIQSRIQTLTKELRTYEESVQLLRAGVKDDLNQYRKDRANKLIKSHSTHIQQLSTEITKLAPKLATPISSVPYNAELARELGFSTDPPPAGNGGDDDDDTPEPRRFPESSPSNGNDLDANPWSREALSDQSSYPSRPFHIEDDRSSASSLLQHIHHFDTNPSTTRHSRSVVWESDADVKDCRRCNKRFGLLNRRHHCRRCGLIVCVKCSSSRAILAASEIIRNPNEMVADHVLEAQYHRICDKCYADLGINA